MTERIQPIPVSTDILFRDELGINPIDMLAHQPTVRLPIEGQYVPLYVFDRSFNKVHPTLEAVGDAAVRLTLGHDFGFMTADVARTRRTQLVPDLVFSKNDALPVWTLTVQTPDVLSDHEKNVFGDAALQYAINTQRALRDA